MNNQVHIYKASRGRAFLHLLLTFVITALALYTMFSLLYSDLDHAVVLTRTVCVAIGTSVVPLFKLCRRVRPHDYVLTDETLTGPVKAGRFRIERITVNLADIAVDRSCLHPVIGSWIKTHSGKEFLIDTSYHSRSRIRNLLMEIEKRNSQHVPPGGRGEAPRP